MVCEIHHNLKGKKEIVRPLNTLKRLSPPRTDHTRTALRLFPDGTDSTLRGRGQSGQELEAAFKPFHAVLTP